MFLDNIRRGQAPNKAKKISKTKLTNLDADAVQCRHVKPHRAHPGAVRVKLAK